MPRIDQLQKLLQESPDDAFLNYALALEYRKTRQFDEAIQYLDRCLAQDPGYCYAYYQKGQVLEDRGETVDAAAVYRAGIAAARRVGDAKAEGELSQALAIVE